MRIFPVLDLLDGVVVRGVAGKRDEYRPVESCLAASADALPMARAFRDRLGLDELYVADLDAILKDRPNLSLCRALAEDGFQIMVDAGLRDLQRARNFLDAGCKIVIAGLETSLGPEQLRSLCREFGAERMIFSLDMKGGLPLGDLSAWNTSDPFEIGTQAIQSGVQRIIVLDLAAVGVDKGLCTADLCRRFLGQFEGLDVITGGGVRNVDDLKSAELLGVDGVLIASALHDSGIGRPEIESFC